MWADGQWIDSLAGLIWQQQESYFVRQEKHGGGVWIRLPASDLRAGHYLPGNHSTWSPLLFSRHGAQFGVANRRGYAGFRSSSRSTEKLCVIWFESGWACKRWSLEKRLKSTPFSGKQLTVFLPEFVRLKMGGELRVQVYQSGCKPWVPRCSLRSNTSSEGTLCMLSLPCRDYCKIH